MKGLEGFRIRAGINRVQTDTEREPKIKHKRSVLEHQLPPVPHGAPAGRRKGEQHDGPGGSSGADSHWQERMEHNAEAWDSARPGLVEDLQRAAPQHRLQFSPAPVLQGVQAAIDAAFQEEQQQHSCCMSSGSTDCLGAVRKHPVKVVEAPHVQGYVGVPSATCGACKAEVSVRPISLGYAPSAPLVSGIWINLILVALFNFLNLKHGVSADATAAAFNYVATLHNPEALMVTEKRRGKDGEEEEVVVERPLNPEPLFVAAAEHNKVVGTACSRCGLGLDSDPEPEPLQLCPACAKDTTASAPRHPCIAVSADACTKGCKFANCGCKQQGIEPSTSTFLGGKAFKRVDKMQQEQQQQQPGSAPEDEAASATCTTALHCSRTTTLHRGLLDICGLAIIVCAHGFPALGLALAIPSAEQHAFYDALFSALLLARADICHIYLDLACRYAGAFQRLLHGMVDRSEIAPAVARRIRLLVPWMHAFDHDLSCQLLYRGLDLKGAGRRIGEGTEHLWSLVKPVGKLLRYAARHHFVDQYNAALGLLSAIKQLEFPQLLCNKWTGLAAKKKKLDRAMRNLVDDARAHGVTNLDAALAAVQGAEKAPPTLSLEAQYVQTQMLLDGHQTMASGRAPLLLALPGSTGLAVNDKGGDARKVAKLQTQLDMLATQLGLPWDTLRLEPSDERYQRGLAELVSSVVAQYQQQIGVAQFKYKLLAENRKDESDKNAGKLDKRIIATKKCAPSRLHAHFDCA
eukprot:scaffold2.g7383.t1